MKYLDIFLILLESVFVYRIKPHAKSPIEWKSFALRMLDNKEVMKIWKEWEHDFDNGGMYDGRTQKADDQITSIAKKIYLG